RRPAVPRHVPARRQPPRRGRHRHRARQALPQQGPAGDPRGGAQRPRPGRRAQGAGRGEPADHPLHTAGGRPAQGGPAHASRRHRGPPASARSAADHGDAGRRQPPGGRGCPAVRRSQAAPRSRVPERMSEHDERARPGLLSAGSVVRTALVVLLAYAVLGAVAGVVWEWIWTPPGQIIDRHQVLFDSYASLRRLFSGTGLYALVGGLTSALIALAVTTLTRGRELWILLF